MVEINKAFFLQYQYQTSVTTSHDRRFHVQHLIKTKVCARGCALFKAPGLHMRQLEEKCAKSPMAPQYAPSLRSRLAPLLLFLQIGFIVIYAFYIEIESSLNVGGITFNKFYPGM